MQGESVLALLPTGGGKSLCYQVPAVLYSGVTLVISPLISLMDDQVEALKQKGIKAEAIHSGKSKRDVDRILDNCIYGEVKLLYLSPERLSQELFLTRIAKVHLSLLAIDEAHCISQWGHDFRPAYLQIIRFLSDFSSIPVIAVTATATPRVVNEITMHINRVDVKVVRGSFLRDNIHISLRKTEDKIGTLKKYIANRLGKTIIYIRSRRQVEMIAEVLTQSGVRSAFYHAGMDYEAKNKIQESFSSGAIEVIVATNAFGMGIDIADVRHVCHFGLPGSLEEFYQEIGRAGRDGHSSESLAIFNKNDTNEIEQSTFYRLPEWSDLIHFYKYLWVHFQINIGEGQHFRSRIEYELLARQWSINSKRAHHIISAYQQLGILQIEEDNTDRILVIADMSVQDMRRLDLPLLEAEVLDFCMRKLEGFFEQWTELDIDDLRRTLGVKKELIADALVSLKKWKSIRYFLDRSGLKVHFLNNRLQQEEFTTYKAKYNMLSEMYTERRRHIKEFVDMVRCANELILNYFGEETTPFCRHCTYCDRQSIAQFISPYDYQALYERAWNTTDELTLRALQQLHNEGLINLMAKEL